MDVDQPGMILRETAKLSSVAYEETSCYFLLPQGVSEPTSETGSVSTLRQSVLTCVCTMGCSVESFKEQLCCLNLDLYQLSNPWESHLGSLSPSSFSKLTV